MLLPHLRLLAAFALLALTAVPLGAADYSTINMPARASYRKPSELSDNSQYWRHIKMTVAPVDFPYPLLKYRFNISSTELEPGNAVPLYSEAYAAYKQIYAEAENKWYASKEFFELKKSGAPDEILRRERFHAVPLKAAWPYDYPNSVSPQEEAIFYKAMEPVDLLLERASRMCDADWTYHVENKGIETSLGVLQGMRTLARYISGKADWEIRNGKYEEAAKTIRIGIALSNHLSKSTFPTLVSMLVGIAIQAMMQERIMDLSSQPDGPNLYPALTQTLYHSDALQYALQGEQMLAFSPLKSIQANEDLEKASPEQCRQKLEQIAILGFQIGSNQWSDNPDKAKTSMSLAAFCTLCYPNARDRLLTKGRTPDEIENLSVFQVVAPYVFEEIKGVYDRILVTATFPPGSSHTAIGIKEGRFNRIESHSPVDVYLALLEPSLDAMRTAHLRVQQGLELLKIIEAIRYYADVRDGQLPQALADIKEVVIATNDPMTGKPFGYRVQGRTAIIDYTHALSKCRLEITVEEPAAPHKASK